MAPIGTVDERFQSYNVEMVEVTGGRFWKPYAATGSAPERNEADRYQYRPPIDLTDPTLRKLAAALGPAYVRVSGTWANSTCFAASDPPESAPPPGFNSVLTHAQWKGVVEFSHAVEAKIVTSMAISAGARDATGRWIPDQARRLFAYTAALGGEIAAVEFMNEPNAGEISGAPKGYDADAYGRDFSAFRALVSEAAPDTMVVGPGSIGEKPAPPGSEPPLATWNLLAATSPGIDAFSYHHYGAASKRCVAAHWWPQTTPDAALSEEWLATTDQSMAFYRGLRDAFEPGRPLWLTETADTVCGGNPWAATFLDTFRYLDQLGRLARAGVQVVMHNTLAASDYGLLDEKTYSPRPNYWGALLWRRLMGTTVLDSGVPIAAGLHVYAHSLPGASGGVTLLAINTDRRAERVVELPIAARRYSLSADDLQSVDARLNGALLTLGAKGVLPTLTGIVTAPGPVVLAPATVTFLTMESAGNPACA